MKFQYVWEDLVRKCLKDDKSNPKSVEFKKSLSDKFNRTELRRKWFF
jgi:hypothetical protein